MYIVKFVCQEARSAHDDIVTESGFESYLAKERDNWVPYTMGYPNVSEYRDAKVFKTKESAKRAFHTFKNNPHPWYCKPFPFSMKIVEVEEITETKIVGYKVKDDDYY